MQPESTDATRKLNAQIPLSIEMGGLTKQFGDKCILKDLSLNVVQGEFLVILGESGCGKSTLLRLITGLDRPLIGTIRIGGVDQNRIAPHQRDVAAVFQDRNGYDHLTVRRNLELACKNGNARNTISLWVERLKIGATLDLRLNQISGGELQRVAIARAMLSGKSIVLLDEPLTHLNQSLRDEIQDLILMVHRESRKTFVYVTHDSDEAFYLANRIAILADGQIQQVESPRTLYSSPASIAVSQLLGQPTMNVLMLPQSCFGASDGTDSTLIPCGVRCNDWKITRVSADSKFEHVNCKNRLATTDSGLSASGTIRNCRWMGNRWLLEIECGSKIRITCDSPAEIHIEGVLREVEGNSRNGERCEHPAHLEATIERSKIHLFRRPK